MHFSNQDRQKAISCYPPTQTDGSLLLRASEQVLAEILEVLLLQHDPAPHW